MCVPKGFTSLDRQTHFVSSCLAGHFEFIFISVYELICIGRVSCVCPLAVAAALSGPLGHSSGDRLVAGSEGERGDGHTYVFQPIFSGIYSVYYTEKYCQTFIPQ